MPSILARLKRLERQMPASTGPALAIVMTNSDRHSIRRVNRYLVYLYVPWKDAYSADVADPLEDLDGEQRTLMESSAKVVILTREPTRGADGEVIEREFWEDVP
jgi:hypothetical protein